MCQSGAENGTTPEATPTSEVEFHADDYSLDYFDTPDRTETMISDDTQGDGNPGDPTYSV